MVSTPRSSPELIVLKLNDFFANIDLNYWTHKLLGEYYSTFRSDFPSALKILKEMGFKGRAVVKTYNNAEYIVLSGYPGLREILKGTRYRADNIKIVDMVIGKAGLAKSVLEGTALTVVLVTAVDIFQHFMNDKETLADLGVTIAFDLTTTAISSIAAFVAGSLAVGTGIAFLPLAAGIVVGVGVGLGLEYVDRKFEIKKQMQNYVNKQIQDLELSTENAMRDFINQIWMMSTLGTSLEGTSYPGSW